jgi:hypothetical protein
MTFTMATPGAGRPPARQPKPPLAPLGDVRRLPGRNGLEVWFALTADKKWAMQRFEDDGTTWAVGDVATKTVVKEFLGSLEQCQAYIASGEAQEDFEHLQACAPGCSGTSRAGWPR